MRWLSHCYCDLFPGGCQPQLLMSGSSHKRSIYAAQAAAANMMHPEHRHNKANCQPPYDSKQPSQHARAPCVWHESAPSELPSPTRCSHMHRLNCMCHMHNMVACEGAKSDARYIAAAASTAVQNVQGMGCISLYTLDAAKQMACS